MKQWTKSSTKILEIDRTLVCYGGRFCVDLFTARVAAAASTASEASGLHWLVRAEWQLHCILEVGASEKWYFQAAKKICIPPSMVNYHSGPLEQGGKGGGLIPPSQTQTLTLSKSGGGRLCSPNYVLKGNSALFTQDSFFAFLISIDISIKIHKFVFQPVVFIKPRLNLDTIWPLNSLFNL